MPTSRSIRAIFLSYSFGEFIAKGLNLLLILMLPFLVSQEAYGHIALLIATETIGLILVSGGGGPSFLRVYGRLRKYPRIFILSAFLGWISWAMPAAITLGIINFFLLSAFSTLQLSPLLVLAFSTYIFLLAVRENIFSLLRVEARIRPYLIFKITSQIVKFILVICFTWLMTPQAGYILGSLLSTAFGFMILTPYGVALIGGKHRYNKVVARRVLRFGLPLLLSGLCISCMGFGDRYILEWLLTSKDVAIYSFANTIAGASFFFVNMLSLTLLPGLFAFRRFSSEASRYLSRMTLISISGVLAFSIVLYGVFVSITSLFLPAYQAGMPIMPILLLKFSFLPLYLHGQYTLMLDSNTRTIPLVTVLACGLNIWLNCLAIPKFGIMGAAWATLFSETVLVIAMNLIAWKARLRLIHHCPGSKIEIHTIEESR